MSSPDDIQSGDNIPCADVPLAVIGMACRLPGANDLQEYWSLMIEGRSAIAELPASRLDQSLYYDPNIGRLGKTYSKIGGIVPDSTTPIKPGRLSAADIASADRSHLQLCQVAFQAIRDAGMNPGDLPGKRGGVYVGHQRGSTLINDLTVNVMASHAMQCLRETSGFAKLAGDQHDDMIREMLTQFRGGLPRRQPGGGPFLGSSEAPRLISKAVGLDGPFLSINAACSSSLVALAAGAHALQSGDVELAVVGGVSNCKLDALVLFSQAQSVSGTGSRPFDADADGLVAAEGYVIVLLKTLQRALADKDPIRAVIRGIGVSSDGKGKSLWAPRREGQIAAVRRAYSAEIRPDSVQYIEAHATSTPLGDSTEVNSLAEVFGDYLGPNQKIPIGSVKANIGHTLESAGLAGLVKTVLAINHRMIPPLINLRRPNPKINWDKAPFTLPTEAMPWPDPIAAGPRRAGVNAFGIGGLNAHVVVEEHRPGTSIHVRSPGIKSPEDRSIAIVGASLIVPGARTIESFWELLSNGQDPKTPIPADRWDVSLDECEAAKSWVGGFINDYQYDWKTHRIPPKQVQHADPLQFMILDAVEQALQSSGHLSRLDHERSAVIVANVVGGEYSSQLHVGLRLPVFRQAIERVLRNKGFPDERIAETSQEFAAALLKRMPAMLDETGGFSNSTLASRVTKTFNLLGGAFAIDSADQSSMMAIDTARGFLYRGGCKMVIAAAGQRALGPDTFEKLRLSGRLSPGARVASLDQDSDGMAPAEGVAVVLLKRTCDAKADGDDILAVIQEVGVARSDDPQTAQSLAIERALSAASAKPQQVSAIELSACGVADEEREELESVADKYSGNREHPLHLRSLAGQIGHAGGASGMISLVKSALSLKNLSSPVGIPPRRLIECASNRGWFELPMTNTPLRPFDSSGRVLSALNSYSNGLACHVLIERGQRVPMPDSPSAPTTSQRSMSDPSSEYKVWHLETDTLPDLIGAATRIAKGEPFELSQLSHSGARISLAIVHRNSDELRKKAQLFVSRHNHAQRGPLFDSQGIYFVQRTQRPKIAFLFSGQGSQYPGMLVDLVREHPVATDAAARIDTILRSLDYPRFHNLVVDEAEQLGSDVWRTQLSVLVADSILFEVVTAMGIRPDRISAHSYGEFPALVAAGAWDFREAAVATYQRCKLITDATETEGSMLACDLNRVAAQQHCDQTPGEVFVANCNSDKQTVIGGSHDAIQALHLRMNDHGVQSRILSVPRPYHTPLMAPIQQPFGQFLRGTHIEPPTTPLLSSVDNRYVAEPDGIRNNLVDQFVKPVVYPAQIQRLIDEGVRVLVEIGPGQVLTRLHHQIVGEDLLVVDTDSKKRSHHETLARLDAALKAAGVRSEKVDVAVRQPEPDSAAATKMQTQPKTKSGDGLTVLTLEGSPHEMGLAHGRAMAGAIGQMIDRYRELSRGKLGKGLPDLTIAKSMSHQLFDQTAIEELRGIAEATGIGVESLLEHNLYGHPDIGAGCTQILARRHSDGASSKPHWLHAANEDMPLGLFLRDAMQRCVQVRKPNGGLPHVLFSAAGHVLGINGVNSAGVVLTSSMLLDMPRRSETLGGFLHSVIVRRVLETASSVDEAVETIRRQQRTGGWGVCISDAKGSEAAYVEYDGESLQVKPITEHRLVSNHARLLSSVTEPPPHSLTRMHRLESLWQQLADDELSVPEGQRWLRDRYDEARGREVRYPTMNTIRRVDNQLSVLFDVRKAKAWATAGPSTQTDEDRFFELDLQELIGLKAGRPAVVEPATGAKQHVIPWSTFLSRSISVDGRPPVDHSQETCNRFAMRCIQVPDARQANIAQEFTAGVLLLGDNGAADSIAKSLRSSGVRCRHLRDLQDVETALANLESLCRSSLPTNLILLTAFDQLAAADTNHQSWQDRRGPGMLVPYQVCQRWLTLLQDNDLVDQGKIIGGVRLGGLFGFDDNVTSPEGGFTTGLIKGLLIEQGLAANTRFRARVVDFDTDADTAFVAARLIDEAAVAGGRLAEVAYHGGKRHAVAPLIQPVQNEPAVDVNFGKVWVVTGGARGVTAKIAKAIGQQFGVKLHLIGSTAMPTIKAEWRNLNNEQQQALRAQIVREALHRGEVPIQAWSRVEKALEIDQNLRELAAAGLDVTYHACDVGDHQALAGVLESIRRKDGGIDGVVHGAGFEKAGSFRKKKIENVERTIAAKVDGAVSLIELTRQDPLKFFVAFSSIAGRFGGVGQTDYCLSNELLCKLVGWLRKTRPEVRAVALDWPSWDEVGMAVRPESKIAKTLVDATFMPVAEGVKHFINELRKGCPEGETLITDWERYKRYYSDEFVASLKPADGLKQSIPNAGANLPSSDQPKSPGSGVSVDRFPLIDSVQKLADQTDRGILASVVVDPVHDCFLSQHLLRGRPIFPFVAAIEAFAQTASLCAGAGNVTTIEDLHIAESLRFFTDDPQEIRVRAMNRDGCVQCTLLSDFKNRKGIVLRKDRAHADCVVRFDDIDLPPASEVHFPDVDYFPVTYPDHTLAVYHGPIYRQLEEFYYSEQASWAKIRIPDPKEFLGSRSGQRVFLPCALIDTCVFSAGVHEWTIDRTAVALPRSIGRLRLIATPAIGQLAIARIVPIESTDQYATFDIDVWDENGRPLLRIDQYRADVLVATVPLDRAPVTAPS